ncbi:MAG: ATP-binding protein [Promethearchaeota archaeon]|nr:MAG: ATP-binding protein [Candidatus Lokiarchaeota archaeon]
MSEEIFKLDKCPPKFFVGRKREKEQFLKILHKIADQEDISHGLILHGRAGIGKKSFLEQVENIAESENFEVIRYDVPFSNPEGYFDYINNILQQIHKPKEKQKPIKKPGKKAPLLKRPYEIKKDLEKYIGQFLKKIVKKLHKTINKLDKKKNKKGILVISNLFERFIILNNDTVFRVLEAIDKEIRATEKKPNQPILFLISVWEKYFPKFRYELGDFHEIGLPTLNNEDARELLQKRATAAGIQLSDEIKDNLIRHSGGIPLNLVYNEKLLYENRGDARELGKDVWFEVEGEVKQDFGRELEKLNDEEREVLQAFAMENSNYADVDAIARSIDATAEETKPILEKMVGKYLSKEGDIYYVTLDSFWVYLRSNLGDIAVDAQARGLIRIAMNLAENGRLLEDFQFNELEKLRSDALSAGLVPAVEHIANGYYDIALNYFNYGYYNESFKFVLLAGDSLIEVNEKEKAGNILEDFTEKFINKSLLDYARDVLMKSIEVYKMLDETEKANNLTIKLAKLLDEKADICINEKSYPLARANFTQAKTYFQEVSENEELINLLSKAANVFMSNEEYFYAWQFYKSLLNAYINQGQKDKAKELFDESIQKFESLGLRDFVDKLNSQRSKIFIQGGIS